MKKHKNNKLNLLKEQIKQMANDLIDEKRTVARLEGELDENREWIKKIEGTRSKEYEQIDWLRNLVELITVDANKFKQLDELHKQSNILKRY